MLFTSTIFSNAEIAPGYRRIRLSAPPAFTAARPGQFVMVRVGGEPLLRRPFAVFDIGVSDTPDEALGGSRAWFEMLYKVVGKGTSLLASLREEAEVNILGPLGAGFLHEGDAEEHLLVGGGIGLAPLYLLAADLVKKQRAPVRLFAGGRTHADLLCLEDFQRLGIDCHTATEDGSHGERGFVTLALTRYLDALPGKAALYACGPEGMLGAIARIAAERELPCQVSLEAHMACGVGACLACVVPGKRHAPQTPDYRRVCAEGPVFPAAELQWQP